jgi:hypothetical protein
MFCDLLASANKGATGPHSAAIAKVELLFVGYPAAEDDPGGAAGKRVFRVAASAPETAGMGQSPSAPALSPLVRPANPRFSGPAVSLIFSAAGSQYAYDEDAAPPPASSQASASQAAAPSNPDEELKNWIYVDFTGKPLTAAELSTASDSLMVHRMPFVIRVVIDQRQIDPLLVGLSTAPVPIDVRQVRINASGSPVADPTAGDAARPMADEGAGFGSGSGSGSGRIYDVSLELRGTVELATPPSKKAVGLDSAESGDKAAATPEAAMSAPAALRRTAS